MKTSIIINDTKTNINQILYMAYRKIRAPIGIPLGFTLMYAAYTGTFTEQILFTALGLFWIEVFAGLYNDYWDMDEDLRNGRSDKFTTLGIVTRRQMRLLSYATGFIGLLILIKTNLPVFFLGFYYFILFIGYSHPRIRLKGWLGGYAILSSMYLFFPFALNTMTLKSNPLDAYFALFCFTQFMYILCQKDSTDPQDTSNLFILNGWGKSTLLTVFFAAASSLLLAKISVINPILIFVWLFNFVIKTVNVYNMHTRQITRELRSKLVLMEFMTPFLYVGVVALGV